ncbi:MAG: hypothetical protein JWO44_2045 [Bacteroidetes bacterium]|nr:hypothetical protein [Bacteroidota bacterium]
MIELRLNTKRHCDPPRRRSNLVLRAILAVANRNGVIRFKINNKLLVKRSSAQPGDFFCLYFYMN